MALYKLFQQWQQFFGETMFIALFTVVLVLFSAVTCSAEIEYYGIAAWAVCCFVLSFSISKFVKP